MSLILKNVSKSFVGKKAVDNISFSLQEPGVRVGLLREMKYRMPSVLESA